MAGFINRYYRDDWRERSSADGNPEFKNGSFFREDLMDAFAVYDGGGNLMGYVRSNGNFVLSGEADEYKASFLRSAKEVLTEAGEVYGGCNA